MVKRRQQSIRQEPIRIVLAMPAELVERIDDYRFTHRLLSRAQAIRSLIEIGLKHPAPSRPLRPGGSPP